MSNPAILIGFSGMRLASARLETSASNTANMSTTGGVPGSFNPVYEPVDVVAFTSGSHGQPAGVDYSIQRRSNGYFTTYEPASPNADADGMIAVPAVDLAAELVQTRMAVQLFQASAMAVKAINKAEKSAIDLLA